MTPAELLTQALDAVARPLRGLSGLARLLAGLAAAVALFALVAWLIRAGALAAPGWILAAWVATALVLATAWWLARRAIAGLGPWHVGARLEALGGWRHGALTTVLDAPAPDTSPALHVAAATLRAEEVRQRGATMLAPAMAEQRRRSRVAAALLLLAVAGLAAARPATGAPARLWKPLAAWRALTAPVRLTARDSTVGRGEAAVLDLSVAGYRRATLYTRAPGEGWHASNVALDADGNATITTAPLTADLIARLAAGGRVSPDVHVAVRLAAFLGGFTARAHYPAYLGLDDEVLPTGGDTLVLPEGTRLELAGRATTPLASATLTGPSGVVPLPVTGTSFSGPLVPRESGSWQLAVTPAAGGRLEGEVAPLPIRLVADSAPVVDIPVPGIDTVATAAMSLSIVVGIRDDHGLTAATLESWHGRQGPVSRMTLPLPSATPDRALLAAALDLTALGLHPGDTLHYVATATDNAPAHHVGRSREFVVRVPSLTEQRTAQNRATAIAATAFDSMTAQSARVQRAEEDLARERQRTDAADGSGSDGSQHTPLANDAARKAAAVAQAQQKILDDAARLQQSVQQLRDAAQRDGVADSSLARELNDINRLLDQALSPELRSKLAALQDAVKALDADRTRTSLQDLAKAQAELKAAMDQARELFKRAALETTLANLGQDARQLATEQHALNAALAQHDSGAAARTESQLAQRADSLAAGLQRTAPAVPAAAPRDHLQQAAQQARSAAGKMRDAARESQQGNAGAAAQDGKQAEDELNPLSQKIDDDRKSMQAEMRAEVKAALDRALQETARLARQQLDVVSAFEQGGILAETRQREGLVEEGAAKVSQQLAAVAAMNALVSPQASVALAEARSLIRGAIAAAAAASPNVRDAWQKAGDAVDQLAVAAYSLMQSKDKVNGSASGSGVQEAMEQMQQMAGKQGQLAQQGAGMMQGSPSAEQVMQLAMQQRALAQQLERMRAAGQLPGAGQLAREAKDLSAAMEAGRLNRDVVDRQQKLFKRMLDAGRSLQGDEDDQQKQRQSTTAIDRPAAIPAALDPRIRNGAGELRLPSWETLQHLAPDERRRVIEYFQRLTQGGPP